MGLKWGWWWVGVHCCHAGWGRFIFGNGHSKSTACTHTDGKLFDSTNVCVKQQGPAPRWGSPPPSGHEVGESKRGSFTDAGLKCHILKASTQTLFRPISITCAAWHYTFGDKVHLQRRDWALRVYRVSADPKVQIGSLGSRRSWTITRNTRWHLEPGPQTKNPWSALSYSANILKNFLGFGETQLSQNANWWQIVPMFQFVFFPPHAAVNSHHAVSLAPQLHLCHLDKYSSFHSKEKKRQKD